MNIEDIDIDSKKLSEAFAYLSIGFKALSISLLPYGRGWEIATREVNKEEQQKKEEAVEMKEEPKVEEPASVEEEAPVAEEPKAEEPEKHDPKETAAQIRKILTRVLKTDKAGARAVLSRFGTSVTDVEQNHPEKLDALLDEAISAFGEEV